MPKIGTSVPFLIAMLAATAFALTSCGQTGVRDAVWGQYPGCDTPDIVLSNGQRWAACNVGATMAYSGQEYPSIAAPTAEQKAYLGAYFQWGRNVDVTAGPSVAGPLTAAAAASETRFVTDDSGLRDWRSEQDDDLWGGAESTPSEGTFISLGTPGAMKGPCAAGYHVPTAMEWASAVSSVTGLAQGAKVTDQAKRDLFASTLKLPLAGYRNFSYATYTYQGMNGTYWTSSPKKGNLGYLVRISDVEVYPANYAVRADGLSVRCMAD